jgi:hypothetical protein
LLQRERKPLLDEAEFYKGKQLPSALKAQLDANDAATAGPARRDAQVQQRGELAHQPPLRRRAGAPAPPVGRRGQPGSSGMARRPPAAGPRPRARRGQPPQSR